jgi:hypothetical protein
MRSLTSTRAAVPRTARTAFAGDPRQRRRVEIALANLNEVHTSARGRRCLCDQGGLRFAAEPAPVRNQGDDG